MLDAGLDLSRKRLEFHLLDGEGATVEVGAAPPHADGLRGLSERIARHGAPVRAAIESMNGARFVHDRLELAGWQVEIADAQKVKGLAPLACKTDRIDARVLAELAGVTWCRRSGSPTRSSAPSASGPAAAAPRPPPLELEAARARRPAHARQAVPGLRSVRHPRPPAPRPPWPAGAVARDDRSQPAPDPRARARDQRLRARAAPARRRSSLRAAALHRARDQLGARLHDRRRARRHQPLPQPAQAGGLQRPLPARLPIRRARPARPARQRGPRYLRWALVEAATHGCTHPAYRERYTQTKARIGKQRGAKVAQVDLARRLAEAIWHMLTRDQPFAPAGGADPLAA